MVAKMKGGFVEIQNQMYNKSIDRGFDFNIMIIGKSCLGKTTFVNNVFPSKKLAEEYNSVQFKSVATTEIKETKLLLNEKGVELRLNIIDTPGFGECIDNSKCCDVFIKYINSCYDKAIKKELAFDRNLFDTDPCVHMCLYFISPNSHKLSELDIFAMKKIHNLVNIIPIIAKMDTLTVMERSNLKSQIMQDIKHHEINIFSFPKVDNFYSSSNNQTPEMPFGVICGNMASGDGTKRVRAYPWGQIEILNRDYNEFDILRQNIFG